MLLSKPEFKQQYLAPIRVLEEEEQCQLLQKLLDREISLQQLKGETDKSEHFTQHLSVSQILNPGRKPENNFPTLQQMSR